MSELDGPPAHDGPPVSPSEKRRFFLSPELFIYPLILVGALVFVFLFFGEIGGEKRSIGQLIGAIGAGGMLDWQGPRRAAEELANRIQELEARGEKLDEENTRRLIEAMKTREGDPLIHRYLVHALGRGGREELAFPQLVAILSDARNPLEARVEAIRGLGLSRAEAAVPPLLNALSSFQRPEEWEARANVLQMLTNLARSGLGVGPRAEVAGALRRHLLDTSPLVARNSAMWLAESFHDPAGAELLRPLLDWEFLAAQGLDREGQEWWMRRAIQCLAELKDEESLPSIRKHASENRSYKVKDAAIRALSLEGPPSGAAS